MIISDSRQVKPDLSIKPGDMLDIKKFNLLPGPVTAKMIGGGDYWIETLDVQTGLMRVDVCGMIDLTEFSMVDWLVDASGEKHDPDDFYLG
jgi:hypothetical protein